MTSTRVKIVSTVSRPAMRHALEVITDLKLRREHKHCDRKVCEIAEDRWTHCVHGTFVGDWAGPDYMCGWCEDGVGDYEYALCVALDRQRAIVADLRKAMMRAALDVMADPERGSWLSPADVAEIHPIMFELSDWRRRRR